MKKFIKLKLTSQIALTSLIAVFAIAGVVSAATTIGSNISSDGALTITGDSKLYGDTSVGGALTATSTLAVTGDFNVNGNATTTAATGDIRTEGALQLGADKTLTLQGTGGIIGATGNIDFTKFKLTGASGNTTIGGTLGVTGATTLSSTLGVTGATTLNSTLGVIGDFNVNSKATITAATGDIRTEGALHLGADKTLTLQGTGGIIGATGNINFTKFKVIGASGNTTIGGTLDVTGATTLGSTLGVTGDLNVNGKATTTATTGDIRTEGSLTIGAGTAISKHISATSSLTFGAVGANSCGTQTMTVTGATDGDSVVLGIPNTLATASSTITFTGWVSGTNTVSVRLCQVAAEAGKFPAATVRADVWKH